MSDLPGQVNPTDGWQELPPGLPPTGILAGMSGESLLNLAEYGDYFTVRAGEEVITEGRPQDRLYILVTGSLEILASVSGSQIKLADVESGECIGELSVLEPGPASATVLATADSVLWSMDGDALHNYISEHPGGGGVFLMGMAQILSVRLHEANRRIAESNVAPAYVPARTEEVITAPTPSQLGFFEKIKKSLSGESKVEISTRIKL
jgi:CRP/FNR family transcriptional regulator, cyclic AMP receptor protein